MEKLNISQICSLKRVPAPIMTQSFKNEKYVDTSSVVQEKSLNLEMIHFPQISLGSIVRRLTWKKPFWKFCYAKPYYFWLCFVYQNFQNGYFQISLLTILIEDSLCSCDTNLEYRDYPGTCTLRWTVAAITGKEIQMNQTF